MFFILNVFYCFMFLFMFFMFTGFLMSCFLFLLKHKRTKLQIKFISHGQIAFSCF